MLPKVLFSSRTITNHIKKTYFMNYKKHNLNLTNESAGIVDFF